MMISDFALFIISFLSEDLPESKSRISVIVDEYKYEYIHINIYIILKDLTK